MSSAIETEIKFRVGSVRSLTARLRAAGFHVITRRTHETNTLYDLPGQPLRNRGALLRVRKYGEQWIVTFKGRARLGRYKSRPEIETAVADTAHQEVECHVDFLQGSDALDRMS